MALRFMEGFDWVGTQEQLNGRWVIQTTSANVQLVTDVAFPPGKALRLTNTQDNVYHLHSIDTTNQRIVFGFRYRREDGNQVAVVKIGLGTLVRATLVRNADGRFKWIAGSTISGAGVLTTSEQTFIGAWAYVEVSVKLETAPLGDVKIAINGIAAQSAPNVVTASGGTTSHRLTLSALNSSVQHAFDDFYLADDTAGIVTDVIGDSQVVQAVPNGDVLAEFGTPGVGPTHFTEVDQASGDDGLFVSDTQTPPKEDRFSHGTFTSPLGPMDTVYALQAGALWQDDGGGAPNGKLVIQSGASRNVSGTLFVPDGQYRSVYHPVEKNPNGDVPWVDTTADASQVGVITVAIPEVL